VNGGSGSILLKNSGKSLSTDLTAHENSILRRFLRAIGFHATYARATLRWRRVRSALSSFQQNRPGAASREGPLRGVRSNDHARVRQLIERRRSRPLHSMRGPLEDEAHLSRARFGERECKGILATEASVVCCGSHHTRRLVQIRQQFGRED